MLRVPLCHYTSSWVYFLKNGKDPGKRPPGNIINQDKVYKD